MKIAFFTEAGYNGNVPRTNTNMRTDQAWICALDAIHFNVMHTPSEQFDIGIIIIPKEHNREKLANQNYPLISNLRKVCNKIAIMQEGTHWDWMEDSVNTMCWFYNQLLEADLLLCHNDIDVKYYTGLTNKPCYVMPTLMIEDNIKISEHKHDQVFVAGNWHQTYRGFDAWIIGQEFGLPMNSFKAGKYRHGEQEVTGMTYLPWMDWSAFMFELSKCKYGVQTYETSAGQFPLNCAYLGIPCIGYNQVNTQRLLHPNLSVDVGDVYSARMLAQQLTTDIDFYNQCSLECKQLYNALYSETVFIKNIKEILK
jgi:hypothetical protein